MSELRFSAGLLPTAFPPVATVSRHKVSTVQVCCLRPVFPSVTHRVGFGPPTVTRHVCCLRPVSPSLTHRVGFGPPTVSRHVCCLRPVFPLSLTGSGSGRPVSRHEVSTVQVCCLRPASLLSLTGPRGKVYDCWWPVSGLLPHCLPSGQAGVDVTPTQIPTSRADGQ